MMQGGVGCVSDVLVGARTCCVCVVTSCFASSGMNSIMAMRTRHWLSSLSSMMAGSRDCDSSSTPITACTDSSFEMMLRRT